MKNLVSVVLSLFFWLLLNSSQISMNQAGLVRGELQRPKHVSAKFQLRGIPTDIIHFRLGQCSADGCKYCGELNFT